LRGGSSNWAGASFGAAAASWPENWNAGISMAGSWNAGSSIAGIWTVGSSIVWMTERVQFTSSTIASRSDALLTTKTIRPIATVRNAQRPGRRRRPSERIAAPIGK
jgi:hypothetical protein